MPKTSSLISFFLFQISLLQAQSSSGRIVGTVKNQSGNPISNVTIQLKGTSSGALTDNNGQFGISVPAGRVVLIASSIGYKTAEKVAVINGTESVSLNFELRKNLEDLEEVVVKGIIAKEKVITTSSSATKSNMSLMNTPAPIVVVGGYLLEQQANSTIQESIRNVSGVTQAGNNYNIGDNLIIRGLDANYAYDGMYGGGSLGNTFNPVR